MDSGFNIRLHHFSTSFKTKTKAKQTTVKIMSNPLSNI